MVYILVFQYLVLLKRGYNWLSDRDSPYAFASEKMCRFNVPEELERLIRRAG